MYIVKVKKKDINKSSSDFPKQTTQYDCQVILTGFQLTDYMRRAAIFLSNLKNNI